MLRQPSPPPGERPVPFLEHFPEDDGPAQRIVCQCFPFRIGRDESCEHVIYSYQVSKQHATIVSGAEGFSIRDVGSTNGTFVNGRRVDLVLLHEGDIIHIAHKEFRFGILPPPSAVATNETLPAAMVETGGTHTHPTLPRESGEPVGIIYGREALHEIMRDQQVQVVFQPILDMKTREVTGFEALGRGLHAELSQNPTDLFRLAERCGMASQLSTLFRGIALKEAARLAGGRSFFFNVHPSEMLNEAFVASLGEAAANFGGGRRLVLEVHEDVVADVPRLHLLRARLNSLEIGLAYDDFGAGQARFNELAEVPPDFIKLDMSLIRGIHKAGARQDVVRALTKVCVRLGVRVIAEGIETVEEANCCRQLGCHWAQGFLFGHPMPAAQLPQPKQVDTKQVDLRPVLQKLRSLHGG